MSHFYRMCLHVKSFSKTVFFFTFYLFLLFIAKLAIGVLFGKAPHRTELTFTNYNLYEKELFNFWLIYSNIFVFVLKKQNGF
jgi:hypothetical protein